MTSSPSTWHRIVGVLGLTWGALELSALGRAFSDGRENLNPYTLWLLVLSLAIIVLGQGLPGWLLLSRKRPTRRTALVVAGLTTLSALSLLFVAAAARYLRDSPSVEPNPDPFVYHQWLIILAAALVRLPLIAALVSSSAHARPQTPAN